MPSDGDDDSGRPRCVGPDVRVVHPLNSYENLSITRDVTSDPEWEADDTHQV